MTKNQFHTMAGIACMKSFLLVFNFVFWLSGILILGIGVWMLANWYHYLVLNLECCGTAPYVLIGIGALIFIVSSLACCCTLKGQPVLLHVYGAFLAVIFILELGVGVSLYKYQDKVTEGFDKGLDEAMINYRNDTLRTAKDFNNMQQLFHCCGNHKPDDWLKLVPPQPIPQSCCLKPGCNTSDSFQIYEQGCYDKVVAFLRAHIGIVAGVAVGIAVIPLLGVILSCFLATIIKKTKYDPMT